MSGVTVITGASSGIGAAIAERFAAAGDTVVLMARRVEALNEVAARVTELGGRPLVIPVDVTRKADVLHAFQKVYRDLSSVDRLIINAGIGDPTRAHNFSADQFQRVIDVNLQGPANCLEAVLPEMIKRGAGQIVGIGSLAGYRGLPGSGAYCASKAGLAVLLESLRLELRHVGVTVTLICPGFIRTPLTDKNLFSMPFLMDLDVAATRIYTAIMRKSSEYSFPWQLAWIVRLARYLPNWLYDRITGGAAAKGKTSE